MLSRRLASSLALSVLLPAATVHAYEEKTLEVRTYESVTYEDVEEPSAAAMAADVVVARPLGLVATMLGTVFYVVAFPFAAVAGDIDTPARRLIGDPARYTFDRPLGHIQGPSTPTSIHD